MLAVPFLTNVDSRAEVKGSRDPLGAQAVWTRFGRTVVKNLTTVSTLLRDFTITILGHHFAARIADEGAPGTELATFLKWEQLAGYARMKVLKQRSFRGRDQVGARLAKGDRIVLSEDRSGQILSNQKIYGLWGLYTSPTRESGLLADADPTTLAPPAVELLEKVYFPRLATLGFRDGKKIISLLKQPRPRIDPHGEHLPLLKAVAALLEPTLVPGEREIYRRHLVCAGRSEASADHVQPLLAQLLLDAGKGGDFRWSPATVRRLARDAAPNGDAGERLADRLERIRICDSLLAPCSMLFGYLLTLDGVSVADAAARIQKVWGVRLSTVALSEVRSLEADLRAVGEELGAGWIAMAETAAGGDYAALIALLVEQNRRVMALRGAGAGWVEIAGSRLNVRFRDDEGRLPTNEELVELWRFPYFMDSLRTIAVAVEGSNGG